MDKRSTATFTRTRSLKYILQVAGKYSTESTDCPVSNILETDYVDTELIEKTRHVKRLPRFYTSQLGHGILLLPVPDDQVPYLATGYWNSLKILNQEYFDESFDIPTRLLESTYLSLHDNFDGNILESFTNLAIISHPYIKKTRKFHII
jgi:hypothetical protein